MDSESEKSASSSRSAHRAFATTSWSMVLDATDSDAGTARDALTDLCRAYWFPLYSYVRRRGFDRSQSEDLTQAFFADLLEKDRLNHATPTRGSFRTFLLSSLNNFIKNHWRSESALKRGGGQTILSFDYDKADNRYVAEPADDETAERIFDRNWAHSILEQTLAAVKAQYVESGKAELFDSLSGFLTGEEKIAYAELAEKTGMKEGALKVAVHRLRQRYGQQLRLQIAKTVLDPTQVDAELDLLFQALE